MTQAQPNSAPEAQDPCAEFRDVDIAMAGRAAVCAEDVMQMAKAHLQTQIGDAVGFPAGMVAFHTASRDLRLCITLRQVIAERKVAKLRKIEKRKAKAAKAVADAEQAERDAAQAVIDAEKAAHRARLDDIKWETFELIDAFGTPPEATEGECKATMERLERLEREQESLYLTLPPHVLAEKVCKYLKTTPPGSASCATPRRASPPKTEFPTIPGATPRRFCNPPPQNTKHLGPRFRGGDGGVGARSRAGFNPGSGCQRHRPLGDLGVLGGQNRKRPRQRTRSCLFVWFVVNS